MAMLTNAGDGPLQVPGFGSREMAMLRLMQHITEQAGWDRAILDSDETQLAQWFRDATEGPEGCLISTAAWDWCTAELRDKAETGRE
ncbi:hypothetical protein P175DRAFT_0559870 [Aspergillus ochraceoroseus IBT 24754]|uniref:DUF4246 domain-containing protein n=1 Tax=Aspergillus ochraceoroseus IBT 24754 TaxID=1392256 RepID=A0A2T5LRY8_9EURO|nr:uncharacterized protein P175DRAFT_0559870 [Aspergillus ochraceoroseus IBT 24754]PTU19049.1 hypothetical protein P175DRAFT_0559870 [Aspergillus ochraceoroseus IBT 24754]